jgi:hypothetical protein
LYRDDVGRGVDIRAVAFDGTGRQVTKRFAQPGHSTVAARSGMSPSAA